MKNLLRVVGVALIMNFCAFGAHAEGKVVIGHESHGVAADKAVVWTCSMHPQIRRNAPGKCPICEMELIPLKESASTQHDPAMPVLKLNAYAEKLAEVTTVKAVKKFVPRNVLLSGKIDYDESKIAHIAARFAGRVDELYVNYTGIPVRKGDHIAEVFSPDLIIMQREYLLTLDSVRRNAGNNDGLPEQSVESVKTKMRIWGFSPEQIERIGKSGKISENLTILSPIDGIVIEKNVVNGQYFNKEQKLFTIADLSSLWLILDAYETDLPFLRYGQDVAFQAEAWPGETFHGRISYISPVMNLLARTVPVRVNLNNANGKLKPGMFVKAEVYATVNRNGMILDDKLAGKWISPMHPEIIKDVPGKCDICGMALVPAESLGFVGRDALSTEAPLVIPSSAPLITGRRAVVYIRTGPGTYEGRPIVLGPKVGDYYVVKSGLNEGDDVVTHGNMKIDGAVQIAGGRSMTSPENFDLPIVPVTQPSTAFTTKLMAVYPSYFALHKPLVDANATAATAGFESFRQAVKAIPDTDAISNWERLRDELLLPESTDLAVMRQQYSALSVLLYRLADEHGLKSKGLEFHRFFCPMAFNNQGAYWLQDNPTLENPYFGKMMLHCGEEK